MRFALPALALAILSPLAATAQAQQPQAVPRTYRALYDRGLELEARAAATRSTEERVRNYRLAAAVFERALSARAQQGITDHTIYNALGTVYLGAGDLASADRHLRQGLANARSLSEPDQGRLYNTVGYLYALRGDSSAARRYYAWAARLGNESARRSLATLQGR